MMLKLSCAFRSQNVCIMKESENSSDLSSRSWRNFTGTKRAWTGPVRSYDWLLPISYRGLSNLSDQHSPPAILASASHVSRHDATQAGARIALGPVLSLSWVFPPPGCAKRFFLGFWASGHHFFSWVLHPFWPVVTPSFSRVAGLFPCVRPKDKNPSIPPLSLLLFFQDFPLFYPSIPPPSLLHLHPFLPFFLSYSLLWKLLSACAVCTRLYRFFALSFSGRFTASCLSFSGRRRPSLLR